jgi:hypothetical protein
MQNEQKAETAEIWRAAQHRRTEDLAKWGHFLVAQRPLMLRTSLARALAIAAITLAAVTFVSAVVDAKRPPHVVIMSAGPTPAVNVP